MKLRDQIREMLQELVDTDPDDIVENDRVEQATTIVMGYILERIDT